MYVQLNIENENIGLKEKKNHILRQLCRKIVLECPLF